MSKQIVVGVTGGIACYKALDVISKLRKLDHEITVIMTAHALEFVEPLSFQTLSKNPVITDMFAATDAWEVEHISIAQKADLFLIVPATANCIGKIANGIADDMLSTTIMATKKPVLFAPAMNTAMYNNPIVQENILKLKALGYLFIEPAEGLLACGDIGAGKLPDPENIVSEALKILYQAEAQSADKDLFGKRVLVTAGPTVEAIDPVRFISNRSTGKMGFAIAEAAYDRGAEVTLIAGPVNLQCSLGINRINVNSTSDMSQAVNDCYDKTDVVIMAAAPSDYRTMHFSDNKMKKTDKPINIDLIPNDDILAGLGKKKGNKILIGFAAETDNLEEYAQEKIKKKNLDYIVANDVTLEGAGFQSDTNIITIIDAAGQIKSYEKMSKRNAADVILDLLIR
jgi:phosphopantothenoylcysteine decarboxylase/phosphopantothenate--cysteine ligase